MDNTCFRCSVSQEKLLDDDYLFFDEHFLNDYTYDKEGKKENNPKKHFLHNSKERFLKYLNYEKEIINCDLQDVYKKVYMNLHLCKKCKGLHNIDLILFYNKNSSFHHNMIKEKLLFSPEEEQKINDNFNNMKKIFHILLYNIDIVFFFFYLHEAKKISENENISLHTFQKIFEQIKEYVIVKVKIENDFIKQKIYKVFIFVLIYFYLTFYIKIFKTLNLSKEKIEFAVNLYKQSVLIFTANTTEEDKDKNNEFNESLYKHESRKNYHYKRQKIIDNIEDSKKFNSYNANDTYNCSANDEGANKIEKKADEEGLAKKEEDNELATKISPFVFDIYISLNNLCICGYYNKYSKEISQTKWLENDSFVSILSVEECIYEIFRKIFLSTSCTFIGSGREDKDARMMNIGRPFVFVLRETKFSYLNFFLFFSKLKKLATNYSTSSDTSEIKTIDQLNNFLQHYKPTSENSICENSFRENLLCQSSLNQYSGNEEKTHDSSHEIKEFYALITKNNTFSLYDIISNKVIVEQAKDKTLEEHKIGIYHISYNYNKELEVLLSDDSKLNKETCNNQKIHILGNAENGYTDDVYLHFNSNKIDHIDNNIVDTEDKNVLKKGITKNKNSLCYNINDLVDVKLSNIAFSTNYKLIKKVMKYGEERKKAYKCLIYHSTLMNKEKIQQINNDVLNYEKNSSYVISVMQKTPIRVLHRRGLIQRERKVYEFNLVFIHEHFSLLYILAQSGMYVKEFVNGDRGRTFPNMKYFFGEDAFVNILNLDVSSFIYNVN
ncbi:conserved Plasmodium protein, unknown function [Plasmodium malariae]|uniref:tRNA pseudouridine(55) synthase n=1 Tax=Plasmodium malariae TaxID=5858 RepID=A0A1A8WD70_PLAMA|nr:conserved Plasmodium protein, unknown function [Plasmodium malariae]SBS89984.1 conserved Plasmodium protein, unknown function [Plasmodium malariae]SCP02914.1 conserved Plasmodium protein, unknown function [Plasmodium malariae]